MWAAGGSSPWLNAHRGDDMLANDFALDIVRLNGLGNRANGLVATDLTTYAIYGDAVHSPCTGTLASAVDGALDQIPPSEDHSRPATMS